MRRLALAMLLLLALSGCAQPSVPCPEQPYVDLPEAASYVEDDSLPFCFPMDSTATDMVEYPARFCSENWDGSRYTYHAAEDYHQPPGTPVYAIADGEISFSGPMAGYGWLIIVDHPQANMYSLYGHLSPSRWYAEPGPVSKGELIAYLGDPDENGGSAENPLRPHLHFGIRAGQRIDYPGSGEWRWMAGWVEVCPTAMGWMRPSEVIAAQEIPPGGFTTVKGGLLAEWGLGLMLGAFYLAAAIGWLLFAVAKGKHAIIFLASGAFSVVAWVLRFKDIRLSFVLVVMAILLLGIEAYRLMRRRRPSAP